MQAFTLAIDAATAELVAVADLRTLEDGAEIARRIFARHIAPRWASEFEERWGGVRRAYSFAAKLRCVSCNAPATEVALELVDDRGWHCEDAVACRRRTTQQPTVHQWTPEPLRLFEAA